MTVHVVTGATGFIGRHLVNSLVAQGKTVRALTRRPLDTSQAPPGIEWVEGDMESPDVWTHLLEKDCIVFNLAYTNVLAQPAAVDATLKLIESCAAASVAHLVHCSTVSVYGRALDTQITEDSVCRPFDAYGMVKWRLEEVLREHTRARFPLSIVRPSTVFGAGGDALQKMLYDIVHGNALQNHLRSCLFGRRKTHLVPVETVTAALEFIALAPPAGDAETVIVAEDEDPLNNFRDVELQLRKALGMPASILPWVPLPAILLETAMRMKGRAIVNTRARYLSTKLHQHGFVSPVSLAHALNKFAAVK